MSFSDTYISRAPDEQKEALAKIRDILRDTLIPLGYEERESYGMIGYVVPFSTYPDGYHCDTRLPLPCINLASRKTGISLYHMGISCDADLQKWWITEYSKICGEPDLGKGCIKFKNIEKIPYDLVRELMQKMDAKRWIELYEKVYKK